MSSSSTSADAERKFRDLGELVWLAGHSPAHARLQIDEIGDVFLVPESLGQLRRWYRGTAPVALASWAYLSEAAEIAYLSSGQVPPDAWKSGPRLWFIDVIAPFGDAKAVAGELRRLIPPGEIAKSARWTDTGVLRKVGSFAGPRPAAD